MSRLYLAINVSIWCSWHHYYIAFTIQWQ